jgi:Kazal-type serine protease inhibitor domain
MGTLRSIFFVVGLIGCSASGLPGPGGTTGGGTTGGGTTGGGPPRSCGGFAGAACAADEFCDYPDGSQCGANDATGTCKQRPQACIDVYSPVCGCDGVEYSNLCYANGAGTDVAFAGPCESPPTPPGSCGAETGATCASDEYCYFTPGQMCDWADGTGTCMKRPQACTDIYSPVCGCDSMTYGNECDAASQGVGTAYQGECGKPLSDCRTTGCPTGQRCDLCWTSYECLDPNVAC